MAQNIELKAGRIITFSEGEYSDYRYCGTFVALQDVPKEEMMDAVAKIKKVQEASDDEGIFTDGSGEFLAEMIQRGWLAIIDMQEIHIGSYGHLDLS